MVSARLWSVLTHHHPRIPQTKHFNSNRSSLEGKLSQRDNDKKNLLTTNHRPFKLPFTNCFTMFCLDVSTYHHISSFFGWLQLHQVADLESEEILRAAVSAAPVGCRPGPGNGLPTHQWDQRTKCYWSIYHEQNPIPKLSCCFGFIMFFHTFSWFIMGLSYFYHVEPYHPYGSNDVRGPVGLAWCESIGPWDDQGWDLRWFNMTWYDLTHTHTFVPHLGHGLKLQ